MIVILRVSKDWETLKLENSLHFVWRLNVVRGSAGGVGRRREKGQTTPQITQRR